MLKVDRFYQAVVNKCNSSGQSNYYLLVSFLTRNLEIKTYEQSTSIIVVLLYFDCQQ